MGYREQRGAWGGGAGGNAAPEPSGEIVATLDRPGFGGKPDSEPRVTVDEFQGHRFLALRLWEAGRNPGEWFPTRKGVSIRLNEAATVAAAILEGLDKAGGPPDATGGKSPSTPGPRPSPLPARAQPRRRDEGRASWQETAKAMEPATPGFSEFDGEGGRS